MLSLVGSAIFVLLAAGVGRWLSRLTRADKCSASERLVIDAAIGLGAVSLAVFALAACQLLKMPWGLAAAVVFGALGALKLPAAVRDIVHLLRSAASRGSVSSWLVGLLLLALAISALIPALAPPAMSDWDSLAYHLAVPKLYLTHGGFYYINFASHSNFPFLMEMLYTPWLAVGLPAAAKMMHYWTGALLVLAVVVLTRRHLSPKAAPMAAIAIAGMPIVLWEASTAYIDLATGLYTVLAVHLLLAYLDTDDRHCLVGCGAAAGFAASTKMTGITVLPMLVLWLVIDRFIQRRQFAWKSATALAGVGLLACSPWYLKTLIYTGSPVYPFFYSIFGGRDWTVQLAANYAALQKHFGMGHDAAAFLLLPYNLTLHSEAFYDTPGLFVGPIFLVFLPVLALGRYRSRASVGLLLFFLGQLLAWFALSHQSRYLIPAFGVLAAFGSCAAVCDERLRIASRALMAAFVLTALFGLVTMIPAVMNTTPVVLGSETRADYLSRSLDVYRAQDYINSHLPKDARVALFGDTRGFYLDRDYVWADPGHNTLFSRNFRSVGEFIGHLRSLGITHAMVNSRFHPPDKIIQRSIEEGRFQQIYPSGDEPSKVTVFKVI